MSQPNRQCRVRSCAFHSVDSAAALLNFILGTCQSGPPLCRRDVMRGWAELEKRQLDDFSAGSALR